MLLKDTAEIGKKLFEIRKSKGLTQAEVAELSELSERAYAEIERGSTNARVLSIINICEALNLSPDEILTNPDKEKTAEDVLEIFNSCTDKEKELIIRFIQSLMM